MATTRNDTETNYTGTNFAVATLIVLLVLVGGYYLIAQSKDIADDPANQPVSSSSRVESPTE